jgi:hypothetical protein
VYMSKQSGMDTQKVLQSQYITEQTLYMTHLREANDVLKLTTSRQFPRKKKKFSGGFRGVSALESEVAESSEFHAFSDEIRRWSSLSENECQHFAEDDILNEFEHHEPLYSNSTHQKNCLYSTQGLELSPPRLFFFHHVL